MKTSKVAVPLVIYLIIAVGMLAIYKWVGESLSYDATIAWALYTGFRALYLIVMREKAVELFMTHNVDQKGLVLMTIAVGIFPFMVLGWWGCFSVGCVCLAFERNSQRLIQEYARSKEDGRHYD